MLALYHTSLQRSQSQEAKAAFIRPAHNRGMTLIELLAVMVVLVILTAITWALLSNVRDKTLQTQCASNLRQIALANLIYAHEYDGYIVGGSGRGTTAFPDNMPPEQRFWWWRLLPYLGVTHVTNDTVCDVLVCPGDPGRGGEGYPNYENQSKIWKRSYGRNNFLHHDSDGALPPKNLSEIEHAPRTAFAGDIAWYQPGLNTHYIREIPPWLNHLGDWHQGNMNIVFLDGRVESFNPATLGIGKQNSWVWTGVPR